MLAWRTYLPLVLVGVFFVSIVFISSFNLTLDTFTTSLLFSPFFLSFEQKTKYKFFSVTFIFLFLISLICFAIPSLAFIIAVISAFFILTKPFSFYFPQYTFADNFLFHAIIFLHNTGISNYFAFFYHLFFDKDTPQFQVQIILLNVFVVIYSLTARYFYSTGILTMPLFVFLILGLMALYCRMCINLYIFITNIVRNDARFFHLFEGENPLPQKEPLEQRPFIDFSRKTNNYNNYPPIQPNKWSFSAKAALWTGVVTGAAACYTAYYSQVQAEATIRQNELTEKQNKLTEKQNYEFTRQNDLECVGQGLMSREAYCVKYSQDCGDYFKALQTPDERAERMLASKKAGVPGIKVSSDK